MINFLTKHLNCSSTIKRILIFLECKTKQITTMQTSCFYFNIKITGAKRWRFSFPCYKCDIHFKGCKLRDWGWARAEFKVGLIALSSGLVSSSFAQWGRDSKKDWLLKIDDCKEAAWSQSPENAFTANVCLQEGTTKNVSFTSSENLWLFWFNCGEQHLVLAIDQYERALLG